MLLGSQAVSCSGDNSQGQLGGGSTTSQSSFAPSGATGASGAPATGLAHTCVLGTDHKVRCWGANTVGQLGDGTTTDRSTPVEVAL